MTETAPGTWTDESYRIVQGAGCVRALYPGVVVEKQLSGAWWDAATIRVLFACHGYDISALEDFSWFARCASLALDDCLPEWTDAEFDEQRLRETLTRYLRGETEESMGETQSRLYQPDAERIARKMNALRWVCDACRAPLGLRAKAHDKTLLGDAEHNDADTLDIHAELRAELADLVGYSALAYMRGEWSWRLRVVAWLSGVCWRVLGGEARG